MSGWRGQAASQPIRRQAEVRHDFWLLGLALALLGLGLVMVTSASMSLALVVPSRLRSLSSSSLYGWPPSLAQAKASSTFFSDLSND